MQEKPKILILSTSLFADRILLFSSLAPYLTQRANVEVWATSLPANGDLWQEKGFIVTEFPIVFDFKERLNVLREINHTAWAYALPAPAILGMHNFGKRRVNRKKRFSFVDLLPLFTFWTGRILGLSRLHGKFENWLLPKLKTASRSPEARIRLTQMQPDIIVSTGPMWMFEAAVAIEAGKLNIPVFSFIPSWDNITTKSRFTFMSSAFGVWSDIRKKELCKYFPRTTPKLVHVVGAPQYDVFFNPQYQESKAMFCSKYGLRADLPIVLWGLGSPLFIKSEFQSGVYALEKMKQTKQLDHIQFLVRPHPNKDHWEMFDLLRGFHPNVVLQEIPQLGVSTVKRTQTDKEIAEWINTICHCDLVLNMTSTILLDGVFFDKPSVNIAYDDTPGAVYDAYLKSINATWPHVNSVVRSGASAYPGNVDDLITAIFEALQHPEEKRELRKKLWRDIVNNPEGRAGEQLAKAILETVSLANNPNGDDRH